MASDYCALYWITGSVTKNESTPEKTDRRRRLRPKSAESLARLERMKELRASGQTLQQIADQFQLTRERTRQLLNSMPRPPKPKPWPRTYFVRIMRQWLWATGIRRCPTCQLWTSDMSPKSRHCRACVRQRVRAYYQTPHGKQKSKEWREANPGKQKLYDKRWQERHTKTQRRSGVIA